MGQTQATITPLPLKRHKALLDIKSNYFASAPREVPKRSRSQRGPRLLRWCRPQPPLVRTQQLGGQREGRLVLMGTTKTCQIDCRESGDETGPKKKKKKKKKKKNPLGPPLQGIGWAQAAILSSTFNKSSGGARRPVDATASVATQQNNLHTSAEAIATNPHTVERAKGKRRKSRQCNDSKGDQKEGRRAP